MVLPKKIISPFFACSLLFSGHSQTVWALIDESEQALHPDPSLSCSVYYIYHVQIIHPGIDLINGSMTHYIHVIHGFSIAHCGIFAVGAKNPTDPRWCGIYGAALRTGDCDRVHDTSLISLIEHCGSNIF